MDVLNSLKNVDTETLQLDELCTLSAIGKLVRKEYEDSNGDVPEWLDGTLRTLKREIQARNQDKLEARLRELKGKREQLKPAEERRKDIADEIDRLEKQLTSTT